MALPELLLVDKPKGITSFDVIRRLRRQYSAAHNGERAPKLGHAGTLDPLASGLMLLGAGPGTKQLAKLIKLDKEYLAEIRLGESRTTGDLEGEIVDEVPLDRAALEGMGGADSFTKTIRAALATLVGTHTLPVSAYSAIKVDGVPMYKRARQAEVTGDTIIDIPMRQMTVYEAAFLGAEEQGDRFAVAVRFHVASGTYIRSLAEALGRQLGLPACLADLRRTQVGQYRVEDAQPLAAIR